MSQLFQELKRRNVFRVAIAYLAIAWLIMQIADVVFNNIVAPAWVMQVLMFFLAVGFPLAVFFAWAFELTPEGIKREHEVDRDKSITHVTGRKLNRTIIVVLAAAVALLLADKFLLRDSGPDLATTDKSVAVLPFIAMSSGPDDEYFADGLTEEILNSLTRVPELLVTARTSAFHFKGQDIPIPQIAATLGVAHIVEGSVRRSGDRMRVTAQLIRADDGFHLWSEQYDHDTDDAFGVQTDIAEKIATALDVVLDEQQLQHMRSVGLQNPEAFVAFQKGIELFNEAHGAAGQVEQMLVANEWFEKVMELAPEFPDAYTYHADYYTHLILGGLADDGPSEEAQRAALASLEEDLANAIRFAPDEGQRAANAYDRDLLTGNWRGLGARFDRIVELNSCYQPSWPELLTTPFGQAADTQRLMRRAIECDPLSFSGYMSLSAASRWLGDFESAVTTAQHGLEATGHRLVAGELIASLIGAGRHDDAGRLIDQRIASEIVRLRLRLAIAALRGDRLATDALLAEVVGNSPELGSGSIAAYAKAGRRDEANSIAALVDAKPFGHLNLLFSLQDCMCGAAFDIESTPNFRTRIEEADLPWPPPSPMDWPFKDW